MTRCIKYNRILVNEQATSSTFVPGIASSSMGMQILGGINGGLLTELYGHVTILFLGALVT